MESHLVEGDSAKKLRIAICGGGIAGLTLAITLGRYSAPHASLEVDIYEADSEIRTVGAGITVWPRTWTVMRHLGLYEDLRDVTVSARSSSDGSDFGFDYKPAFVARKANQPSEGYQYCSVLAPAGSTTMHRKEMVDVFLRHLPPSYTIHTSKRLTRYEQRADDTSLIIHFADGTTASADVLIGADGIHSAVRARMYEASHRDECGSSASGRASSVPLEDCPRCRAANPTWTGVCSYRCLLPTEKLYELNPEHTTAGIGAILCYSGKGKHIITYQISGGKFLNFVALCRVPGGEGTPYGGKWVTDVSRDAFVSEFEGWEPEVQQMLQCAENPTRWAIHVVDSLPFAVTTNVALLGDAMHAMPPNFGAGGGQAIEDAYILGRLLADPRMTRAHMPAALVLYERVRLPFANDVARWARDVGLMYEFNAPGLYDGVSPGLGAGDERRELDVLGEAIQRMWEWQWVESFDEQWECAREGLEEVLKG